VCVCTFHLETIIAICYILFDHDYVAEYLGIFITHVFLDMGEAIEQLDSELAVNRKELQRIQHYKVFLSL